MYEEEKLCTRIMDNVCELEDFIDTRLSTGDYANAKEAPDDFACIKEKLDEIYSDAHAIRGDM